MNDHHALVLVCSLLLLGCGAASDDRDTHDDHDGEDVRPATVLGDEAHDGEEVGAEAHVVLTPEQRARIGLRMQPAASAGLELGKSFPGEVVLVPDRVTHVVPQAAGIVRETFKTIGDHVAAGDILAVIESSELARAKLDFFSAAAEIGHCRIALPRAREIQESVTSLLAVLEADADPDPAALSALDGREMGEWRGRLLSAQAEFEAARAARERETSLRSRGVSTEKDLIEATSGYARKRATLNAEKDTARYSVLLAYSEEARQSQVAELALVTAENRLRVMGVESDWIERLRSLVPRITSSVPHVCPDEDCTEGEVPSIMEALQGEPPLGRYPLRAWQAGIVTEKHLSLGERITGEEAAFVVVDTDRVWVRFNVYQKDLEQVRPGAAVHVFVQGTASAYPGDISFVSPVVDERTRTVEARIELANSDQRLRPGLFVSVTVEDEGGPVAVVVPRDAVQILEEREVVFVEEDGGFAPVHVRTGRRDRDQVEILSGLSAGTPVVVDGAFEIKAQIITEGLGAHAGHGH